MCYSRAVEAERVGIRELRNNASKVVRRAQAGDRIVITVDGVPAARIGPLNDPSDARTLDDLVAAGLLLPAETTAPSSPPRPLRLRPGSPTAAQILDELRGGE